MGKSPNTQVKGGQGGHFTKKRTKGGIAEKGRKRRNLTP